MSASRLLYTLALYALLPRALWHLWWRARRQPEYMEHIAERFGRYAVVSAGTPIWVHAVSVGETRAAEPLVRALQAKYPQHRILLTHMTPTGRATGALLFGDAVVRCYLPYDFPFAVARFLAHFKPACGILLETEIWPNLIHACRERGIPVYLVNARLSEKSHRRYARFRRFVATSLNEMSGIAAQSVDDAGRLKALGAQSVAVTGNLKFDITPAAVELSRGDAWRERWGRSRPVLLWASTREGEEALIIDAYKTHFDDAARVRTLLVIVPRHPQRFDDVHAQIVSAGLRVQRRSESTEISHDAEVWLGDSMGEMFAYLQMCDVAFIGGSLVPVGGQNLIEPCALGKPVLMGPSDFNFADAAKQAEATGAMIRVSDANHFATTARALLDDDQQRAAMSQRALAFAASHRGATEKTVALITHLLK